jgi:daunorubicin resistance ABC transporter ATP-binding subunit/daunorubicin resistance ABC transporter membrane protein
MTPVIKTEGLTRLYGDRRAVDGLDIEVEAGEIFGLLGPNGAGKTTTIQMLTTLLPPSHGRALVCGLDVSRQAAQVRRRIGYVSQEKGVRHLLTGRESVEIEASLHHVPRGLRRQRVEEVLDVVGMLQDADRPVAEYSGGMLKRLDLACGLLQLPQVLILDEPTLGLDVQSRHRIWNHVLHLRSQGVTVLLTTNYLDEADRLCDRLAIIDSGREVVSGAPAELKRRIGGDVVRVSTEHPQKLKELVTDRPWAQRVAVSGHEVHIHVDDVVAAMPEVVRLAQGGGLDVAEVSYKQPTLDDVFLLHTGRGLGGPAEGEAGRAHEDVTVRTPTPVPPARPDPPSGLRGRAQEILALTRRWVLELTRERLNLLFTLLQPAIWLVFFGSAIGRAVNAQVVGTSDYVAFMLPGVVAFTVVGASINGAVPLLWDKETGYLGRLLSMPIARSSLLVSRILFQMLLGAAQALLILAVATAMGVRVASHVLGAGLVLVAAALLTCALTSLFVALAYRSPSHTTFFAISGFATLPLLFTSNAFVPIDAMPNWMAVVARLNPLTYAIESIRTLVIEGWRAEVAVHIGVLALLALACLALSARQFPMGSGRGKG